MTTPPSPNQIPMHDPVAADTLNRRTAGIRQLSHLHDLLRINKQNRMNRDLVRHTQHQQRQFTQGIGGTADMIGGTADMSAGSEIAADEPDDFVNIGDTNYNIRVGDPDQLQSVMAQIERLKEQGAGLVEPQPAQPAQPPPEPTTHVMTPASVPVTVGTTMHAAAPAPPAPLSKSIWPWIAAATLAAGSAGGAIGYLANRPSDDPLRYTLEFDQTNGPTPPEMTIPTPRLGE